MQMKIYYTGGTIPIVLCTEWLIIPGGVVVTEEQHSMK
jgi:hypothetical protein